MIRRTRANAPAIPIENGGECGLTIREWFAGQAIASVSCGIIAEANHGTSAASLAAAAVEIADALLIELAKPLE